jgi:glutamate racemase
MIGVFDSGAGGLTAIFELRRLMPSADICFFKDTKNSPYGTKSHRELIRLVERDILKLCRNGADKILMACCTASTVYDDLPLEIQKISLPIIEPTAREAARVSTYGKIGVIATEATVSSGAFSKALAKYPTVKEVSELALQRLVAMVEEGAADGKLRSRERDELSRLLKPMKNKIDTLILGCTHFPHLEREISGCLPGVKLVSSSREGAREISRLAKNKGTGKTVFL